MLTCCPLCRDTVGAAEMGVGGGWIYLSLAWCHIPGLCLPAVVPRDGEREFCQAGGAGSKVLFLLAVCSGVPGPGMVFCADKLGVCVCVLMLWLHTRGVQGPVGQEEVPVSPAHTSRQRLWEPKALWSRRLWKGLILVLISSCSAGAVRRGLPLSPLPLLAGVAAGRWAQGWEPRPGRTGPHTCSESAELWFPR